MFSLLIVPLSSTASYLSIRVAPEQEASGHLPWPTIDSTILRSLHLAVRRRNCRRSQESRRNRRRWQSRDSDVQSNPVRAVRSRAQSGPYDEADDQMGCRLLKKAMVPSSSSPDLAFSFLPPIADLKNRVGLLVGPMREYVTESPNASEELSSRIVDGKGAFQLGRLWGTTSTTEKFTVLRLLTRQSLVYIAMLFPEE